MSLSPKDLKKRIQAEEIKKKIEQDQITKVLEREQFFRFSKSLVGNEPIKTLPAEQLNPIFEAAISGETSTFFVDIDEESKNFFQNFGFSVDDWDFYSADDLGGIDESLIERYDLDQESEWVEFDHFSNNIAVALNAEISNLEKNIPYLLEEESELLNKIRNLNFKPASSLFYKMDKVDQLNELVNILEDLKNMPRDRLSKGFKTLIKQIPQIQEFIDTANGVSGKYFLTEVSWEINNEFNFDSELAFFDSSVVGWISGNGNQIFKRVFDLIECSIRANKEMCIFEFIQYGDSFSLDMPGQLWLDDNQLEIPLTFFIQIFQSFGYSVTPMELGGGSDNFDDSVKGYSVELKWSLDK